ncbi:MAG: hypothetical protein P1V97_28405 [Planctomycetota bacterium]|nr:hypothetical protein [Planctomycetota bacterium]
MTNRGLCIRKMGRNKDAITDLKKALLLKLEHPNRDKFKLIIRELQTK